MLFTSLAVASYERATIRFVEKWKDVYVSLAKFLYALRNYFFVPLVSEFYAISLEKVRPKIFSFTVCEFLRIFFEKTRPKIFSHIFF